MTLVVDIILLIILLGSLINGWKSGLIRTLAGLIGIFLGIVIAGHYFIAAGQWLESIIGADYPNLSKVAAFAVIFLAVNAVIGVGAYFVDKTFHLLSIIPLVKTINSVLGGILGLISGVVIMGFLALLLDKYPIADVITDFLGASRVVPWLRLMADFILPLLPGLAEKVEGTLDEYSE